MTVPFHHKMWTKKLFLLRELRTMARRFGTQICLDVQAACLLFKWASYICYIFTTFNSLFIVARNDFVLEIDGSQSFLCEAHKSSNPSPLASRSSPLILLPSSWRHPLPLILSTQKICLLHLLPPVTNTSSPNGDAMGGKVVGKGSEREETRYRCLSPPTRHDGMPRSCCCRDGIIRRYASHVL